MRLFKIAAFGFSLPCFFVGALVLFGERNWTTLEADFPKAGTQSTGTLGAFVDPSLALAAQPPAFSPREKCFDLVAINPTRGYAYVFDTCTGSVLQVFVPLPPPAPEPEPEAFPPPSAPGRGNPKVPL